MSTQLITILLTLLIIGMAVVIFLLLKKKEGQDGERLITMTERLSQLAEQNKELRQALDSKLSETHKATQVQFNQTSKLIANVTERLTKLDEQSWCTG